MESQNIRAGYKCRRPTEGGRHRTIAGHTSSGPTKGGKSRTIQKRRAVADAI